MQLNNCQKGITVSLGAHLLVFVLLGLAGWITAFIPYRLFPAECREQKAAVARRQPYRPSPARL